jgi:hypothetical protein
MELIWMAELLDQEPLDAGDGRAPQQDHHTRRGVLGVSTSPFYHQGLVM